MDKTTRRANKRQKLIKHKVHNRNFKELVDNSIKNKCKKRRRSK